MHPPIMRTALNIGAFYGISSFAFFLFLYSKGLAPGSSSSWLGAWIPILFSVWGIRTYRDHECGGTISYWHAFRAGFLTIACGALLFGLLFYLYGIIGSTDLLDNYKQEMLKEVEQTESAMKSLLGDKIYDTMVDNVNKTTLASVAVSDFFNKCLSGFFLSLIVAAFLKRNPPPSEEII